MMRSWVLASVAVAILSGPGLVWAELYAPETLTRMFRIDFEATHTTKGTVIDGYVYNKDLRATGRLVLRIEQFDGSGRVVGATTTWVPGVVASGSRAYFRARVPEASGYRVAVESFEWARCGD